MEKVDKDLQEIADKAIESVKLIGNWEGTEILLKGIVVALINIEVQLDRANRIQYEMLKLKKD